MFRFKHLCFAGLGTSLLCMIGAAFQEPSGAVYRTESNLVLVAFRVVRDKYFVPDLQKTDVVLLEDGKPIDPSSFEPPGANHRTLHLVLLFDTTTWPIGLFYQYVNQIFAFTNQWDARTSRELLEESRSNVQVSLYHFDGNFLERLCRRTNDPEKLTDAVHHLLSLIPFSPLTPSQKAGYELAKKNSGLRWNKVPMRTEPGAGDAIPVELPAGSELRAQAPGCWPNEVVISTLRDSDSDGGNALRTLVFLGYTTSGTTTMPKQVAAVASATGTTINVVSMHVRWRPAAEDPNKPLPPDVAARLMHGAIAQPVNAELAWLTDGSVFDPPEPTLSSILDALKSVRNDGLSQYVIGFAPPAESSSPKDHKLEVRLKPKLKGTVLGGKRTVRY